MTTTTRSKPTMKLKDRLDASEEKATQHEREQFSKGLLVNAPRVSANGVKKAAAAVPSTRKQASTTAQARVGKKATVGHFSEDLSRAVNVLAASNGRTVQSLMGEAWDDLLVKYGLEPFNER